MSKIQQALTCLHCAPVCLHCAPVCLHCAPVRSYCALVCSHCTFANGALIRDDVVATDFFLRDYAIN